MKKPYNEQRVSQIRCRLAEIEGNIDHIIERYNLRAELRELNKEELRNLKSHVTDAEEGKTDSAQLEALKKIASLEDTLKLMCESEGDINPQILMATGFRVAVRLAKQALKDQQ